MENKIAGLKDYFMCGAGQTGQSVIERFQRSKVLFVVIEKDEEKVKELMTQDVLVIHGDATYEDIL